MQMQGKARPQDVLRAGGPGVTGPVPSITTVLDSCCLFIFLSPLASPLFTHLPDSQKQGCLSQQNRYFPLRQSSHFKRLNNKFPFGRIQVKFRLNPAK